MSKREKHIYTVIIGSINHRKVYATHESSSLDAATTWANKQNSYSDYSVSIYKDADELPMKSFDVHAEDNLFNL